MENEVFVTKVSTLQMSGSTYAKVGGCLCLKLRQKIRKTNISVHGYIKNLSNLQYVYIRNKLIAIIVT